MERKSPTRLRNYIMYRKIKILASDRFDIETSCNDLNRQMESWISGMEEFENIKIKILKSKLKVKQKTVIIKIDYIEINKKHLIIEKN